MTMLFDDISGRVGVIAAICGCVLIGSCVQDYSTSTPQVADVLIVDKHYSPAHTDIYSTTDSNGNTTIHSSYYPESWSIDYADRADRYGVSVSKGTWDALHIGEHKVMRFDLGGGWWHARYNEQFIFGPIVAEGSLPVR